MVLSLKNVTSEERNCLGDNDERSFGHMEFELSLAYPVKRFSGQGQLAVKDRSSGELWARRRRGLQHGVGCKPWW